MKSVTVEELKEKLDEVIAEVETGETLSITRGGKTIFRMTPGLTLIPPRDPGRIQDVKISPRPKTLRTDAAQMIIDERDEERSDKKWRS
jgi:antitoxin (DNA-binding transcriptional repressor) of toxin-antitoxin stability system